MFLKSIERLRELIEKAPQKKSFYEGNIQKLLGQLGEVPDLREGEVVYTSLADPQAKRPAFALFKSNAQLPYYSFPTSFSGGTDQRDAVVTNGTHQFVVRSDHPREVLVGTHGHDSLAESKPVWFAGTAYFNNGALDRWDNDTGHYKTRTQHIGQALGPTTDDGAQPLLPATKYQEKYN